MVAIHFLLIFFFGWHSVFSQASVEVKQAKLEYAKADKNYQNDTSALAVARSQYAQSPTNANMEVLLKSFKAMVASRTRVGWAFLEALKVDVQTVTTIPTETKTILIQSLSQKQQEMQDHIERINALSAQDELDSELISYQAKFEALPLAYYPVMVQLKIGKIALASQELRKLHLVLSEQIPQQILIAQIKEERLRGLSDVETTLNSVDSRLEGVKSQLSTTAESQAYYLYDTAREQLEPLYRDINRAYSLLDELSSGVEL